MKSSGNVTPGNVWWEKKTNFFLSFCSCFPRMAPSLWWLGRHRPVPLPALYTHPPSFCYLSHTCQPWSASQSCAHGQMEKLRPCPHNPVQEKGGSHHEEDHIWLLIWKNQRWLFLCLMHLAQRGKEGSHSLFPITNSTESKEVQGEEGEKGERLPG